MQEVGRILLARFYRRQLVRIGIEIQLLIQRIHGVILVKIVSRDISDTAIRIIDGIFGELVAGASCARDVGESANAV
jgi:hypothetical protein